MAKLKSEYLSTIHLQWSRLLSDHPCESSFLQVGVFFEKWELTVKMITVMIFMKKIELLLFRHFDICAKKVCYHDIIT